MEQWPETLPAPALNTLNGSLAKNTTRSNMDKGPAKTRRRTTANAKPLGFSLKLRNDQVDILEEFFDITTFSGADAFLFTHPRTQEIVTARFVEEPSFNEMEGVLYVYNVSLEILPS